MPTKTVVFTGYEKYDEETNGMRILYTDEYIQMAGRAGRRGKDKEGLVIYLPEREPASLGDVQRMMCGSKSTFISRMSFHYDFILKTLQSGNTTWMGLMTQSYWYQQHQRVLEKARGRFVAAKAKLAEVALPPEAVTDMQLKEELETTFKNSVNAAKKKAQQALEQWKNKHMGPLYIQQWVKFCEMRKVQAEVDDAHAEVLSLEKHHESVYPLLRVLETTGFIKPFEDPMDTQLTDLGVLATELNEGNPLLMAYAYHRGLCDTLTGEEILCFLCAFLNEGKETGPSLNNIQIPSTARDALYSLDGLLDVFFDAEKVHRVASPSGFWALNSYWIEPVWRWIQGETVSRICEDYELFDGNFIRVIMKVSNLLEELTSLATFTQNVEMLAKLEGLSAKLVRDVAVPESLYLRV